LLFALKTGILSFDSTRVSANDVGYPIDVLIFNSETFELTEHRFYENDLTELTNYWAEKLKSAVNSIPDNLINKILNKETIKIE